MIPNRTIKRMAAVMLTGLFAVLNPLMLEACPGCNSALTGLVGRGFNLSILFLMAMPFLLVGSMAFGLIFVYRSHQSAAKESNYSIKQMNKKEENESESSYDDACGN
ncbi:MAG: hypothetical protein ACE5HO_16280 [bacterium]